MNYSETSNIPTFNKGNVSQEKSETDISPLIPALMFVIGVIGNGLALVVLFASKKDRKRTVFYTLAGLLVIVDLTGTIATSPVTLLQYAHLDRWYGGPILCHYFSFMLIFFGNSSMFVVCVMAIERFVALVYPYSYKLHASKRRLVGLLILLLVIAVILAGLPIIGVGSNVIHYPETWCFFNFNAENLNEAVFVYLYAAIGLVTILFLTVANSVVIWSLIKMRRTVRFESPQSESNRMNTLNCEGQMIIFLVGVTCTFIICWAPLMVTAILAQADRLKVTDRLGLLIIRMASFNQIMDPCLYILFRREILFRLFNIMKKSLCLEASSFSVNNSNFENSRNKKVTALSISLQTPQNISHLISHSNICPETAL